MVQTVIGVLHIVSDLDKCCRFYSSIFGFEQKSLLELEGDDYADLFDLKGIKIRVANLSLGAENFWLGQFISHKSKCYPENSRSNDLWFQHLAIVVSDMDQAYEILKKNKVQGISSAPQTIPEWNKSAAGIRAYYFQGPEGHPLEIINFPKGKGLPKWQGCSEHIFLGIDHTAIAIHDTDTSITFYRDFLGMYIVGESLNYGETQERLSGVSGAKVRITAMRFPNSKGVGIEFLQYLNPPDGRTKESPSACDLFATTTIIAVDDVDGMYRRAVKTSIPVLSREIIKSDIIKSGSSSFIVADPDGHRILITNLN
jgi:catechol 2,3-dioxygenase-like lactoylglutathione lyase family enzyme